MSFGRTSQTFGRNIMLPFTAPVSQLNMQNEDQLLSGYLLCLFFTPEDRGSKFFSEPSVNYRTLWCFIPEDNTINCHGCENLTAYKCRLIPRHFKKGCLNNIGCPYEHLYIFLSLFERFNTYFTSISILIYKA